jgi:hypothetical protein
MLDAVPSLRFSRCSCPQCWGGGLLLAGAGTA